jgi:hypothetical protein
MENALKQVRDFEQEVSNQVSNLENQVRIPDNPSNNNHLQQIEVWLVMEEVSNLLGVSEAAIRKAIKVGKYRVQRDLTDGRKPYRIALSSLPIEAQKKWAKMQNPSADENEAMSAIDARALADAPEYNRRKAMKYLAAFKAIEGLKGEAAIQAALDKAGIELDYKSVMRERARYQEQGIAVLIGKYGKRKGISILDDEKRFGKAMRDVYQFFKGVYLKEGAPSLNACYAATLGFAKELGYDAMIQQGDFPSPDTFYDKIHNEIGESAIYLHRYGQSAWNRKYAAFAHRDYANIKAGAVWVSDHRQLDQLWNMPDGTQKRVWITVWRDFKTAKWLSWLLHVEAPNSEHVFETFCQATAKWGVPEEIIIDNGKDYRVSDFAGGRKTHTLEVDAERARSLTAMLGIRVHFSAPYNAQTKPIERDFLLFKEWRDKLSSGYFGGNSTERPEVIQPTLDFAKGELVVNDFVENVLNKNKSNGKVLNGRSRNEAWAEEFEGLKRISEDALRLYRFRVSEEFTIKRNGIYDSKLKDYYYGVWCAGNEGRKVYLRRNPKAYQEAWVFDAKTDEYLGVATLGYWTTAALAKSSLELAKVNEVIRAKKRQKKTLKSLNEQGFKVSEAELVRYQAKGLETAKSSGISEATAKATITTLTKMDEVAATAKRTGTHDISIFGVSDEEAALAREKRKTKYHFLKS